jgi:hypothetical protein
MYSIVERTDVRGMIEEEEAKRHFHLILEYHSPHKIQDLNVPYLIAEYI